MVSPSLVMSHPSRRWWYPSCDSYQCSFPSLLVSSAYDHHQFIEVHSINWYHDSGNKATLMDNPALNDPPPMFSCNFLLNHNSYWLGGESLAIPADAAPCIRAAAAGHAAAAAALHVAEGHDALSHLVMLTSQWNNVKWNKNWKQKSEIQIWHICTWGFGKILGEILCEDFRPDTWT